VAKQKSDIEAQSQEFRDITKDIETSMMSPSATASGFSEEGFDIDAYGDIAPLGAGGSAGTGGGFGGGPAGGPAGPGGIGGGQH